MHYIKNLLTPVLMLVWFLPLSAAAQNLQPVIYVVEYKIQADRIDSLEALTREYGFEWQEAIGERVPGYERYWYRHDTGGEYNWVVVTQYPDWDYIRGDEISYDEIWEDFKAEHDISDAEEERVNGLFEWAFEGATHVDNVLRPVAPEEE